MIFRYFQGKSEIFFLGLIHILNFYFTVRRTPVDRGLHNAVADGEVVQAERRHRQLGRHHRRRRHHLQEDQQVS